MLCYKRRHRYAFLNFKIVEQNQTERIHLKLIVNASSKFQIEIGPTIAIMKYGMAKNKFK